MRKTDFTVNKVNKVPCSYKKWVYVFINKSVVVQIKEILNPLYFTSNTKSGTIGFSSGHHISMAPHGERYKGEWVGWWRFTWTRFKQMRKSHVEALEICCVDQGKLWGQGWELQRDRLWLDANNFMTIRYVLFSFQ